MPRVQAPPKKAKARSWAEHHLLRLARIGPHEHHAAVAEPDMGDLHGHRHAPDQDDLVAPVELVGLARREEQRHIGIRRRRSLRLRPVPRVSTDGVIAALIAEAAKLFVDPDERQLLARRLATIAIQKPVELILPRTDLRHRLPLALVGEGRLIRPENLPNRVPRHVQLAADTLERPSLHMECAPNSGNRIH